ncbi:hypothetical protein ACP70R_003821 [Stipagrostis hirtigluma subsp. patula]
MAPISGCHLAVLLLAVAASLATPHCSRAAAAESGAPKWHVVNVSTLLPSTVCTAAAGGGSNSSSALHVVHRHGPCSPVRSRGGPPPSHAEILRRDRRRIDALRLRIGGSTSRASNSGVSVPVRWGVTLGDGDYVITVGIGTPPRFFSVELDTGSDLSWVQCEPCKGCYEQQDPLFDPARSSTFSAVPCGSPECQDFVTQNCSVDDKCAYLFPYADKSRTEGNLVRDTLTLAPSHTLPGFVFGCGLADNGTFGRTDGLFGLGRDKVSLASQASPRYGTGFSYCLPSSSSATGYLSLGATVPPNMRFTAMVSRSGTGFFPSLYYVNLVGIEVAGRAIKVSPAVFMRTGTIIDSGTVLAYVPSPAYAALRSAFRRSMRRYERAPALDSMDTCYNFTGVTRVKIPSVALVFADGATVSLSARGVLYVSTVSQTCLAFAPTADETQVGVLGNTQQRTFTVVYDVANQKIGFAANGCS